MTPSTQDARATGLVELAVRCEQATGADRELDVLISLEISGTAYTDRDVADLLTVRDEPTGYGRYRPADEYVAKFTASLDAAISLVPEGDWEPYGGAVSPYNVVITTAYNSVGVYPTDGASTGMHDKRGGRSQARTVPLAICAAALRALAASTKDQNDG